MKLEGMKCREVDGKRVRAEIIINAKSRKTAIVSPDKKVERGEEFRRKRRLVEEPAPWLRGCGCTALTFLLHCLIFQEMQ